MVCRPHSIREKLRKRLVAQRRPCGRSRKLAPLPHVWTCGLQRFGLKAVHFKAQAAEALAAVLSCNPINDLSFCKAPHGVFLHAKARQWVDEQRYGLPKDARI